MAQLTLLDIKDATINDVAFIQQIYAYHVATGLGTFEEIAPTLAEMTARFNKLTEQNFPFIVAKLDGEVIGYAYAGDFRERSAYRFTVEDSIYIAPAYCGHGVGQALLAELILRCRGRGYKQLLALIGDSNNHGSINLHQKFGFTLTGVMKDVGYKFERFVDVVIMQLEL